MLLRSEELLQLENGKIVKRWVAERLGIIPVTVTRCLRALGDEFSNSPPHFLFAGEDPPKLFRPSAYFKPAMPSWTGGTNMIDADGQTPCIGFWPQHFVIKNFN